MIIHSNLEKTELITHFFTEITKDQEYWSFRKRAKREYSHALFQYPAMMVPQIQKEFLDKICTIQPNLRWVFDPFVGSGTTLTESMLKGLHFYGNDINPLAILLCKVKSGPFIIDKFYQDWEVIIRNFKKNKKAIIETDFPGLYKWFREDVAIELSNLRRAIRELSDINSRRFFWIAMAETVKLSCNSRTSTYKLHIRPEEEVNNRSIDVFDFFKRIVKRNLENFDEQYKDLEKRDMLRNGYYKNEIIIQLHDTTTNYKKYSEYFDLLLTSPPYGDNTTTIPYGQYSYLPLKWIDLKDIDDHMDITLLTSINTIDAISLGGRKKNVQEDKKTLEKKSSTLKKILQSLKNQPTDRTTRVLAFCRDVDKCLDPILNSLKKDSYMIWTLGNRCVGGKVIPLDKILSEFLINRGNVRHIDTIYRKIPSKRMAVKNNFAKTILKETILIMQKVSSNG